MRVETSHNVPWHSLFWVNIAHQGSSSNEPEMQENAREAEKSKQENNYGEQAIGRRNNGSH